MEWTGGPNNGCFDVSNDEDVMRLAGFMLFVRQRAQDLHSHLMAARAKLSELIGKGDPLIWTLSSQIDNQMELEYPETGTEEDEEEDEEDEIEE